MTDDVIVARIIHSDLKSGRFLVLVTEDQALCYSHWRPFQRAGHPAVTVGQAFRVRLGRDRRDGQTLVVREVLDACETAEVAVTGHGLELPADQPRHLAGSEFLAAIGAAEGVVVIANAVLDGSEQPDLDIAGSVVLINCRVSGDFRWLRARFQGSLWCLNCQFNNHFSLKSAHLDGSVVMFDCDFSGAGGISFRGIRACSLLMEFGTRGSDDMLWLNEMTLSGCLALNGSFEAPVQLMAVQDDAPVNDQPALGGVYIGRQSYHAEQLSRNSFEGGLFFEGYTVSGCVEIRRSHLNQLRLTNVTADSILVDNCELAADLWLDRVVVVDEDTGIAIEDTLVGRHLRMTGRRLRGRCSLVGSSVSQAWMLELEAPDEGTPSIEMARFHAEQAWFDPVSLVYGTSPARRSTTPPPFGLLARARMPRPDREDRRQLAEAYTRFKNWMSATGHLREEDHAFFHMRHHKETSRTRRFLLGGVFGWGIRLRNVLATALMVSVIFSLLYMAIGVGSGEAVMLSLQSFISSFFGQWSEPAPPATGLLSILVTLESMIGVLLVTVLVGAYIRKLLR
ncbi:hypothetical protein ACQUWM_09825 [Marinobacter sp. DUT-3]|uniref:hypothetical protein n=1 Tax=Marinobacter sp. DUT-3 TaxID=3412036 RepID=UPI003D187705